jgi:hypothetical protein
MTQLIRFSRNTPLFLDAKSGQTVKAKCDFVVYIDKPQTETAQPTAAAGVTNGHTDNECNAERPVTTHVMQLTGSIAGAPVRVLFDSGAEQYNYISAAFCQRAGIVLRNSKRPLSVAGIAGAAAQTAQQCTVTLRMQGLASQLNFAVIDMPTAFDVILGDAWLRSMKAQLDYEAATCTVRGKGKHPVILYMDVPDRPTPSLMPTVLSYAQAKRISKQEFWHCLVVVKQVSADSSDTAVCAAAATGPQDARVAQLQAEYPTVFTDHPPHGGSKLQIDYEVIPLEPGTAPILRPMFRYSPAEMEEMEKQIRQLLELGYIQPSLSPFGAPVLFVKKPRSTELRMCIDYRAINRLTRRIAFPLPRIDEMLDHLTGAKVFSLIDLRQAYHQAKLLDSDVPKTAFRSPFGHYEYLTLSFGLVNAPSAFQSLMNKLFSQHLYKFVMVYLDDIIVYSKSEAEHEQHLRIVLDVLKQHSLTAAIHKCSFYQKEVLFLGHVVSAEGVRVDPAKVSAVRDFPVPTDVSHLRSFLGMTNYFRKFIKRYAQVVHPMTDLLKQDTAFCWSAACQESFDKVKELLTTAPVLTIPDWHSQEPFEMVCDASYLGVSGILMQHGHPIAFESRKLTPAERNYSPTEPSHVDELEMLAVVYCVNKWRCYIEGRDVSVFTDHKPNTFFDTSTMQSRRAARWLETLQGHRIKWNYKPGKQNVVADALSRHPVVDSEPGLVSYVGVLTAADVQSAVLHDSLFLQQLRAAYKVDTAFAEVASSYTEKDGLYYKGKTLVLPADAELRQLVLHECHDALYAGHVGTRRTLKNVQRYFYWDGMARDVATYVKTCDSCQRNKSSNQKPAGLLRPLPIPGDTWESVSMDLIVSLPRTAAGYTAIVVFVDRLSKMVRLAPCTDDVSAEQLADIFVAQVVANHGVPRSIVTDRDIRFTSKFWKAFVAQMRVQHGMSTAFHPQSDGNTERVNRVLEDMLRHYIDPTQTNWDFLLPMVQFSINNSYHESINSVPFELVYGKRPYLPLDLVVPRGEESAAAVTCDSATSLADRIQTAVARAKLCLQAAQQRADTLRRELQFAVGDEVLLSTKNIKVKTAGTHKLLPKWIGPFKVLRVVNEVAYKLTLPPSLKIHPVFHVSLLKPYQQSGRVQPPPVPELIEGELEFEVESVLAHRDIQVRRKRNRARTPVLQRQYLIKWKGYDESNNTWEPERNCGNCKDKIDEYFARIRAGAGTNKQKRTADGGLQPVRSSKRVRFAVNRV